MPPFGAFRPAVVPGRLVLMAAVAVAAAACASPAAAPGPAPAAPAVAAARVPGPDELAGVRGRAVPPSGTGRFVVVPGTTPAPARARTTPVRVEVEQGLDVDGEAFATFVLATLNDPRGWGRDGDVGFARTDGDAPVHVRLATPATTDRLCAAEGDGGRLSCRRGPDANLNLARWVTAVPDYRGNLTGYRRYLVNHEVGHVLGHHHVPCPGPGVPAPVMQQQTLGLDGCRPNSWPYP